MEFLIITLALFSGFFKGVLKKASILEFSDNLNAGISASLIIPQDTRNKIQETKETEEEIGNKNTGAAREEVMGYGLQVLEFKNPPIKISEVPEPEILAKSAIILDIETDKILFAKNADEKMPIASISKIFTALIAEEKIEKNKIISVSQEAADTDGSAGDLKAGEEFRSSDLADLMLISSSNDAAVQLAIEISGSAENFSVQMNKKAAEMGLNKTSFAEPSGLSDRNVSTAFEIAQTADASFGKSAIWNILGQKEADIYSLDGADHHLKNTNEIIGENYIIAGKTGYTNAAKGTLVVIADSGQDGRKIISVVLGSDDRFEDTKVLLGWARENFVW